MSWEEKGPRLWGRGNNGCNGIPCVYRISIVNDDSVPIVVYIGKQTDSDRLKNFVQSYLALRDLIRIEENGQVQKSGSWEEAIYGFFKGKENEPHKIGETDYGDKFEATTAFCRDLKQIVKLWEYCKNNNKDFKNLRFKFEIMKCSSKEEAEQKEKYELEQFKLDGKKPPCNTQ